MLRALSGVLAGLGVLAAAPLVPPGRGEPAPEWNAKFAGREGWVGGDGAYSVVLGPRRVLWLFGDSLWGKVKDGGRPGAVMVNNSLGLQEGAGKDAPLRFVCGKTRDGKPAAFFTPADGKGWLWVQAGVRVGGRLFVFLPQIDRSREPGVFGFRHIAQWLAVVDNPDDDPEAWRVRQVKLPFAEFGPARERSWGSAVLAEGEDLYVYGYDEEKGKGIGKKRLTVARVPAAKLDDFAAWRFRTRDGWSATAEEAAGGPEGLASEFSVSRRPGGKGWVLVCTENGLGDRVVGRFADRPEGPWSAPVLLYRCPEPGSDRGVFCYAAKAHPFAGAEGGLLVSYCANTWEFGRLFKDSEVYRPRFVWVKVGAGG